MAIEFQEKVLLSQYRLFVRNQKPQLSQTIDCLLTDIGGEKSLAAEDLKMIRALSVPSDHTDARTRKISESRGMSISSTKEEVRQYCHLFCMSA